MFILFSPHDYINLREAYALLFISLHYISPILLTHYGNAFAWQLNADKSPFQRTFVNQVSIKIIPCNNASHAMSIYHPLYFTIN